MTTTLSPYYYSTMPTTLTLCIDLAYTHPRLYPIHNSTYNQISACLCNLCLDVVVFKQNNYLHLHCIAQLGISVTEASMVSSFLYIVFEHLYSASHSI